jgi:hypothetical protein
MTPDSQRSIAGADGFIVRADLMGTAKGRFPPGGFGRGEDLSGG